MRKPFMKNVLLTGASSGIGLAIAKLLVAEGHEVWGTSRNLQRIPRMPQLHPVRLDLGDPRSVDGAFNAALAEASHFDVLINNAGAGHFGPAELLPAETIEAEDFHLGARTDATTTAIGPHLTLKEARAEFEKQYILTRLRDFAGNISRTADALGMERSNLHRKLHAYGIRVERP